MARRRSNRSGFADLPGVYRPRRNFNLSHRVLTSMPVGKLVPIDFVEVLPGDTWSCKHASLVRTSSSFIHPLMDNIFLDTYTFFVPLRLCQSNLEDVFGDSRPNAYSDLDFARIATFDRAAGMTVAKGSVADYLGLPVGSYATDITTGDSDLSCLPFRAFALIWNEFFRSQAVDNEVNVYQGDSSGVGELPNVDPWSETNYFGMLPPVTRYKDYFSTCLVAPQKGPAVLIPGVQGAPVVTGVSDTVSGQRPSLKFNFASGGGDASTGKFEYNSGGMFLSDISSDSSHGSVYPSNLQVGNSDEATISALRTAFQMQKYLERDSIYGSRYREYLYAAYGVSSPDSRMQVPEFLSGAHNRISIQQQVITAMGENSNGSTLNNYRPGNVAGYSQSMNQKDGRFSKSFTEHGYLFTVGCIRYKHLYSQSLHRLWNRHDRTDFYDPLFANLSQQAVYKREFAFLPSYSSGNDDIFGYQEAWAEYRTLPDRVSGDMRPGSSNSVGDFWSLAEYFTAVPSLVDAVHEDDAPIKRVVTARQIDPFITDFAFQCSVARVVTAYSMPGYADHH